MHLGSKAPGLTLSWTHIVDADGRPHLQAIWTSAAAPVHHKHGPRRLRA